MKKLLFLFAAMMAVFSYAQETYSRVRVYANDIQLHEIHELGIDIDHGKKKRKLLGRNRYV